MAARSKKFAVGLWMAFLAVVAFIVFSPKSESSQRKSAALPEISIDAANDGKTANSSPDAQPASAPLAAFPTAGDLASDITLGLNPTGNDQKLILEVKTNLPPKTLLMATLVSPVNRGGDGYVAEAKAAVQANQVIQFGPFAKDGGRLSHSVYVVTVTTIGAWLQPEEFQSAFGPHGERLAGRQIIALSGTSEKLVSQQFQIEINTDGSVSNLPPDSGKE